MLIKKTKIPIREIILFGLFPSFFKKIIYRLKGYKIGKNVTLGIGSVIIGKQVSIGDNSKIGFVTVIRGKKINIGRFVQIGSMTMIDTEEIQIGEDTRINENVIIGGIKTPESIIKIGKRVIIMEYSFLNPTKPSQTKHQTLCLAGSHDVSPFLLSAQNSFSLLCYLELLFLNSAFFSIRP